MKAKPLYETSVTGANVVTWRHGSAALAEPDRQGRTVVVCDCGRAFARQDPAAAWKRVRFHQWLWSRGKTSR